MLSYQSSVLRVASTNITDRCAKWKNRIPQTLSQESRLETIEENTTFSSGGFIFFN